MVLYRDIKLSNLFILEAKEGENAKTIMNYYKKGGAFSEELEKLIKGFVNNILQYSTQKQLEVDMEIAKINAQKQRKSNSKK